MSWAKHQKKKQFICIILIPQTLHSMYLSKDISTHLLKLSLSFYCRLSIREGSSLLFDLLVYMPFLIMHGGTLKALLWNVSLETCSIVKGAWGSHLEGFLGWCLSQNSGDMRVHWLAGLSRL